MIMCTQNIQLQITYLQSIYLMLKKATERRSGNTLNLYFRLPNSVGLQTGLTSDFYSYSRRLQSMSRYTCLSTPNPPKIY